MDNYQKLEQIVNKAGCSYEDAKAVLESCDWDMIDAIIILEKEGKVKRETAAFTSQKAEEAAEVIPEVIADDNSKAGKKGNAREAGKSGESSKKIRKIGRAHV